MVVITINRDQVWEIAVELHVIEHINDDDVSLTVGLEKATLTIVYDGVTSFGGGNIVENKVVIGIDALHVERSDIGARGIGAWYLVVEKENSILKFYWLWVLFSVKS